MDKDIKEPLFQRVKESKLNWFDESVLKSYQEEQKQRLENIKPKQVDEENIDNNLVKPIQEEKKFIERIEIEHQRYLEQTREFVTDMGEPDLQFYSKATAVHDIPQVQIMTSTVLMSNPSIFATFSQSSDLFETMNLLEHMGLDDYKILSKLRIRNYMSLIKMLYRIYYGHQKQDEKFKEFRTKLFQVQALIKYLGFTDQYVQMYSKLRECETAFIFKVEKKDEENTNGKPSNNEPDFVDEDEEKLGDFDSDQEYEDFFGQTKLTHNGKNFAFELDKEEEKWIIRAEWLESVLNSLQYDPTLIKWHTWFQAKMDSLVDLDVKIKTGSYENQDRVFYLHQFLEEQIRTFNPNEEYEFDQKIQYDSNTVFPQNKINTQDLANDFKGIFKSQTTIREKLCLKILKKEIDTHYYLNVFERKPLGNEKIYEKRINTRHRNVVPSTFKFHPNGEYLYITLSCNSQDINLIFPLKAAYKNPLLIRPKSTFIGFQDKYYFCKVEETLYEYDLYDYKNVKTSNISAVVPGYNEENKISFGRCQDGYSYIGKQIQTEEKKSNFLNYQITVKGESYIIDPNEKIIYNAEAQVQINRKGDQLLIAQWKEATLQFIRFQLDGKGTTKMFKKEEILNFKFSKDLFKFEKKKLEFKIIPLQSQFLIMFHHKKTQNKAFIFQNSTFLTSVETESSYMFDKIFHQEDKLGNIQSIFTFDCEDKKNYISYKLYKEIELKQEKQKLWKQFLISHQILNLQIQVCHPYCIFIYNHNQVLMKDLTKDNQFYYMNNFLAIDRQSRPLTVFASAVSLKYVLNVPTINSNYSNDNFLLKVHQLKTFYQQTNWTKFEGYIRYRIYACNQDIIQTQLQSWFSSYVDSSYNLLQDIRIHNKNNGLSIENWSGRKCVGRLIIAYYYYPPAPGRNLTKEDSGTYFRDWGCWLFILQKENDIMVFTKEVRYSFGLSGFKELEPIYQCQIDDQDEEIYDIIVDNFILGRLDIYLLYSNATLKRITTTKLDYYKLIDSLEEDPYMYSIEQFFKPKGQQGTGNANDQSKQVSGGAAKKIDLWDQSQDILIANRMVYLKDGIVDLKPIKPAERIQTGFQLPTPFWRQDLFTIQKLALSISESKIVAIFGGNELKLRVVISPLLNARQLPLFHANQFIHPAVPLIDQERGFTSVFTLNINHQDSWYHTFNHENYKRKYYNHMKLMNPGLRIKYFNGIEKEVPMSDFGERFLDIIRFNQSLNGSQAIIVGTRIGSLKEKNTLGLRNNEELNQGIFVYEIKTDSIKLIRHILFAKKDISKLESKLQEALKDMIKNELKKSGTQLYVQKEIEKPQYKEYSNEYQLEYNSTVIDYEAEINFAENDDELMKAELVQKYRLEAAQKQSKESSFNIFSMNNHYELTDDQIEEMLNTDEAYKAMVKITDLNELFNEFDIPYLQNMPEEVKLLEEQEKEIYLISLKEETDEEEEEESKEEEAKEDNQDQANEESKIEDNIEEVIVKKEESINAFTEKQREKINKMHINMKLFITNEGHIILIERLRNKVYFFYQDQNGFNLQKIKFEKDFVIQFADSSDEYLTVASKDRFRVYEIKEFANVSKYKNQALKIYLDSKPTIAEVKKDEKVNVDAYELSILDVKQAGPIMIQRVKDNTGFAFQVVFDVKRKINIFYHEGENIGISGCKNYMWLVDQKQVFDMEHELSTFFIWPGDQMRTPGYDHQDLYNVTPDKSMMITTGYIQLAFNIISMHVDKDTVNFKAPDSIINKTKTLSYMYYKIGNNRSILEKIFKEDKDKKAIGVYGEEIVPEEVVKKTEQELEDENQKMISGQMKNLAFVLNYLTDCIVVDEVNASQLGSFFLTYYFLEKDPITKQTNELNIFQKMFSLGKNKRTDIIDDILNYVVKSDVVIVQQVIISCFLEFLETAHTSSAFQDYLRNIMKRTTKMTEVEKFQIETTDEGFVAQCHSSPMMDNQFQANFKQVDEAKKDVDISYVAIGDLLVGEQGKNMMDTLSDEKYLPIMDIPIIQYLVMYQWLNIRRTIQRKLLIPFSILLGFFFMYVTFQVDYYRDVTVAISDETFDSETNETIASSHNEVQQIHFVGIRLVLWAMNVIGLLGILGYLYAMEIKQFVKNPSDYYTDFWNMADIINYTLCTIVIVFDIGNFPITTIRPIASIAVIILWIKLFYFLRVFESTSRLIRMIIEIVNNMKNFLIILVIGILGFANGFYILSQNQMDGQDPFAGSTFAEAIIYTYRLTLGDFDTDAYYTLYPVDVFIVWFIFIIASLFVVIVLLNLLIAIMGDTFSRVLENITNLTIREKVKLVAENEAMFDRDQIFKNSQYLVIIKEKNLEALKASENWDGQMNALKRTIVDKISALEVTFEEQHAGAHLDFKKRFIDFDEKNRKQQTSTETRITSLFKADLDIVVTKVQELFTNLNEKVANQQANIVGVQDQMKQIKVVNDKVERLVNEQAKFRDLMFKHFNIDPKLVADDTEDE